MIEKRMLRKELKPSIQSKGKFSERLTLIPYSHLRESALQEINAEVVGFEISVFLFFWVAL